MSAALSVGCVVRRPVPGEDRAFSAETVVRCPGCRSPFTVGVRYDLPEGASGADADLMHEVVEVRLLTEPWEVGEEAGQHVLECAVSGAFQRAAQASQAAAESLRAVRWPPA